MKIFLFFSGCILMIMGLCVFGFGTLNHSIIKAISGGLMILIGTIGMIIGDNKMVSENKPKANRSEK